VCSFDGACFLLGKEKSIEKHWIHNDTPRDSKLFFNPVLKSEFACPQGVLNMVENGPNDGGLVLVENSHLYFEEYMQRFPTTGYSWKPANAEWFIEKGLRVVKVCAGPGELMVFDGRVFHCNVASKIHSNYRLCNYVSMIPRTRCTDKELEKAIKIYENGGMTGHWRSGKFFYKLNKPFLPGRVQTVNYPDLILNAKPEDALKAQLIGY